MLFKSECALFHLTNYNKPQSHLCIHLLHDIFVYADFEIRVPIVLILQVIDTSPTQKS